MGSLVELRSALVCEFTELSGIHPFEMKSARLGFRIPFPLPVLSQIVGVNGRNLALSIGTFSHVQPSSLLYFPIFHLLKFLHLSGVGELPKFFPF